MKKLALALWVRKRLNRKFRLTAAFASAVLILGGLLFLLPSVSPRFLFTLEDRLTLLTPPGFKLGEFYNFENIYQEKAAETQGGSGRELVLPRPDNKLIVFKYPEVVTLGRPVYLGSEISQSVDFSIKKPPASGLIQIWVLNTSLEEFLEASRNYSSLDFLSFESKKEKKDAMEYTLWDYTFRSEDRVIRALEAFFDDKPYMYRISAFLDSKDYNADFQKIFDDMVKSVRVK